MYFSHAQVTINVTNSSKEDFKGVKLNIFGKKYEFSDLKAGESTRSFVVDKTYKYCFVEVTTIKDNIYFQPIDFTGEKLFKAGMIEFKLKIIKEDGKRKIEIEDINPDN